MNNELLIPTSWQDVTLGEFIELSKLDINNFESPVDYYFKMLSVLGNKNIDEVKEFIKVTDLTNIVSQMSFINTPAEKNDNKEVTIDNTVYKIVKNLNTLTIGEYVSIESLIDKDKLDSVSSIPAILGVILRPEGEEFDSSLVEDRMKLFKTRLSIEDVLGMSLFFWNGVK